MAKAKFVNERPISLDKGSIAVDGKVLYEACKVEVKANFKTWTGSSIGGGGESAKTTGVTFSAKVTHRKQTPWARKILQKYLKDGKTVEMQIQGIQADKDSDFYDNNKKAETVTCNGCVIDGDLALLLLDSSGGVYEDTINFHVHDVDIS